jgi:hypothetical protein
MRIVQPKNKFTAPQEITHLFSDANPDQKSNKNPLRSMAYNIRLPRRMQREENRVQQKHTRERERERESADCERRKKRFMRSSR